MKRELSALVCALSMTLCHAQPAAPAGRQLPDLAVRGADGQQVPLASPDTSGNSVLIVLDASMPSALVFLSALNAKGKELDARVKILVLGDDDTVARLKARVTTLKGGTWVQADKARAIADLQLPGIPCMIGLQGAAKVAWQFSGVPKQPERLFMMTRDWLQGGAGGDLNEADSGKDSGKPAAKGSQQ